MPSGKRETTQWRNLGALALTPPAEIRDRRAAAEQTLSMVRSRLGAPGTYELPGEPGYVAPGPAPTPTESGPAVGTAGYELAMSRAKGGRARQWKAVAGEVGKETPVGGGFVEGSYSDPNVLAYMDPKYGGASTLKGMGQVKKLDPEAYTKQLEQSAEFRMMSRMTAEAEQLIARKGPLWDDLIRNQQLPIIEGSAAMAKESAENLRRAAARGGAARRDAFESIQRMNAQREINTSRMQTIATMRVEMDRWARDNARQQITFNQGWAENLAGIRESYNSAMDNASALFAQASLPVLFATTEKAQEWRNYAYAKSRSTLGRILQGGAGLLSGYYTGRDFGLISGAIGGPEAPV